MEADRIHKTEDETIVVEYDLRFGDEEEDEEEEEMTKEEIKLLLRKIKEGDKR